MVLVHELFLHYKQGMTWKLKKCDQLIINKWQVLSSLSSGFSVFIV